MEKNKSVVKQYNNAKLWQIGFFSLNNCATNIAMFLMMQYSYFTQNVLGLAAAIVGLIATGTRILYYLYYRLYLSDRCYQGRPGCAYQ